MKTALLKIPAVSIAIASFFAVNAAPSAAVNCWGEYHHNGYISNNLFGGAQGWINALSQPYIPNVYTSHVGQWIGVNGSTPCGTYSGCWAQ